MFVDRNTILCTTTGLVLLLIPVICTVNQYNLQFLKETIEDESLAESTSGDGTRIIINGAPSSDQDKSSKHETHDDRGASSSSKHEKQDDRSASSSSKHEKQDDRSASSSSKDEKQDDRSATSSSKHETQDDRSASSPSCHRNVEYTDWIIPQLPDELKEAPQDSASLADAICRDWIISPYTGAWNLQKPNDTYYSRAMPKLDQIIDGILGGKRGGFFIEAGAAFGEYASNSLYFEKSRGWRGLLVEANPDLFKIVLFKRRHAYMVNTCLSPITTPRVAVFKTAHLMGGMEDYIHDSHKRRFGGNYSDIATVEVQCLPLYAILRGLGVTHVDFFSLDIEGAEMSVLKTLPLDVITVDVFCIEFRLGTDVESSEKKLAEIQDYLVGERGYVVERVLYSDVILRRGDSIV